MPAVKIKTTTKKVIQDTTACIFWLKNRNPNKWREKQEIEHSGEIETKQINITLPSGKNIDLGKYKFDKNKAD